MSMIRVQENSGSLRYGWAQLGAMPKNLFELAVLQQVFGVTSSFANVASFVDQWVILFDDGTYATPGFGLLTTFYNIV